MAPHLTYEDIEKIVEEARGWGCRFVTISGGEPTMYWERVPGTKLYEQLHRQGRIIEHDWSKYDGTRCTFAPYGLSAEGIEAGLQWIYQRFYSWGSIVKRTARRLEPVVWMINAMYHSRVRKWVAQLRQQLAVSD